MADLLRAYSGSSVAVVRHRSQSSSTLWAAAERVLVCSYKLL